MAYRKIVSRAKTNANPFVGATKRPGQVISDQFEEAVVIDVIVNNHHDEYANDGYNVGAVKFRFLNSNYFRPEESLHWAFSMDANTTEYPLLNEVVYVFKSLNRFYYLRKFNVSNRPTAQGMFGINEESQPIQSTEDSIRQLKSSVSSPLKTPVSNLSKLGQYFTDKNQVFKLKHLEGDIIYEGRSGQSIRFGTSWLDGRAGATAKDKIKPWQSTKENQSPHILIRIGPDPQAERTTNTQFGQVIEDINKDKTSMWMVSDQIVNLKYSTENSGIHKVSVSDFPRRLDGNQIVINTDRFVVNTKTGKILGHAADGIHLTTLKNFTIDADRDHITWTNNDRRDRVVGSWTEVVGSTKIQSIRDNHTQMTNKKHTISAGTDLDLIADNIYVGAPGNKSEPLVLGSTLRDFLDQLISVLTSQPVVLITGRPGDVSMENPMRIARLQQLKAQYLSNGSQAVILSRDNFTTRNNSNPLTPINISPYTEG